MMAPLTRDQAESVALYSRLTIYRIPDGRAGLTALAKALIQIHLSQRLTPKKAEPLDSDQKEAA